MNRKKISDYVIFKDKLLGKGAYGSVFKGVKKETNQPVAVKIVQKRIINSDDYMKSALFSQIQFLRIIRSDNVVALYNVLQSSHNFYIIQELCDGDLQKELERHHKFDQEKAIQFLKQICNGFLSLVRQGIVHRDLKPANVMLCGSHAKIGDFGFAKKKYKTLKISSTVGTPLYMSPQILRSEPYTSKCDIWALGCIFYEMLHGETPWTAKSQYELVKNIETKQYKLNPDLQQNTKDFIKKCLQRDEQKRISWDQLFVHDVFRGYFKAFSQKNQIFENKLKRILFHLNFTIKEKNIDLRKLFNTFGFRSNQDLSYQEISCLLKSINPDIKRQQLVYFFQKLDQNCDGRVSLKQLQHQMEKNHIKLTSDCQNRLVDVILLENHTFQREEMFEEKKWITPELQLKAKKCFVKLFHILTMKKLTLYRTFVAYDPNRNGSLSIDEFQRILKRLDKSFSREQIEVVFRVIDKDQSGTIEFDELNTFYCNVNEIPLKRDLLIQYTDQKILA